jgi:hypothetical protein
MLKVTHVGGQRHIIGQLLEKLDDALVLPGRQLHEGIKHFII